ncbi:hypothetical protein ACP70R_026510 [Stipagrostis hirtigluma subsp. patula]
MLPLHPLPPGGGGGTALSGGSGSALVAAPALVTEAEEAARALTCGVDGERGADVRSMAA